MSLAEFKNSPWSTPYACYRHSPLSVNPAPEYANSEILISGLYRTLGFDKLSERAVAQERRDLDRRVILARDSGKTPDGAALDGDTFHGLLRVVLESPKRPKQSSRRFLQVSPLVGEAASFSGAARLTGNPWPAGSLMQRMIWLGAGESAAAERHWDGLFSALSVQADDDIFAGFVSDELRAWTQKKWGPKVAFGDEDQIFLPASDVEGLPFPARQYANDLTSMVAAKALMTRRQWISLLEALTRVAAVAHVVWLCEVQKRMWDCLQSALRGEPEFQDMRVMLYPQTFRYLNYGTGAISEIKDRTSKYLKARMGINAVLWALEEAGHPYKGALSSAKEIAELCALVRAHKDTLAAVIGLVADLADQESRTLLCRTGIGNNLQEFARYVLMQRDAADQRLRGYDQGYVLRKRSSSTSSPLICAPGPVAVLAIVHCALAGVAGPRSVHRLAQHMASYGIELDHRDIAQNELGHQLRMLGLVLDSPDAESGMLLVPPFVSRKPRRGGDA